VTFANQGNPINPDLDKSYGGGYYSPAPSGEVVLFFPVCAASASEAPRAAALVPDGAPGNNGCPLNVAVKPLQQARSGLAVDNDSPHEGPVNFTAITYSRTGSDYAGPVQVGQKCESGCVNVLVTVTNKAHKPVKDASVEAYLNGQTYASAETATIYGTDFLCAQTDQDVPSCGRDIKGLTTDQKGQVHLLYWSPGVAPSAPLPIGASDFGGGGTSQWPVDIGVLATKDCSASSCQHQEGIGESTFNVQPYLIYQHTGRLSREYVELLMELVQEGSSFWSDAAKGRVYDSVTEPLIEALELLEKESVAAALAAAGPAIEIVHFIYLTGEAFYKLGKQLGFVAGLLTALNMPGIGIGVDDPFEQDIPDAPTGVFRSALLSGLANEVSIGQGGVLWSDAEALEEQYKSAGKAFAVQPEAVNVKVYEVSHCNMNKPDCGPGYKGSPGIQPALCFYFTGSDSFPEPLQWHAHFCQPYDAAAFAWTQKGLDKSLPANFQQSLADGDA
jgi:hypothetical protein